MTLELGNTCLAVDCRAPAKVKGLCYKHYKQVQRHGETSKAVSAKLINGRKLSAHPLYETWRSITRAARGTCICPEWRDFEKFIEDVGEKPADAKGLRRKNIGLPFSKENAYWYQVTSPAATREAACERMRNFYAANPDYARWASIKKNYGVTKEQYLALSKSQNNTCAICKKPECRKTKDGAPMNLHIDHCHVTSKIRGLLCHKCNAALGLFGDSIEALRAAIGYLEHNN